MTLLLPKAQDLSGTFLKTFTLFSECHKIYDSSSLLTDDTLRKFQLPFFIIFTVLHYRTTH